ncbi:hypothetical protein BC629DRAFT_893440 [Irpex lacteus]|nr:hypothetical protein BC629DRAFT_893440 [Irpex lacteus]
MPEHSDRLQSVPAWTALPESRAQSTSSRASSQDMQEDELVDAPGPSSPTRPHGGHKRKDGGIHRPHDSASKKRKLNERVTVLSGNDDDLPASAHALPVRRPPNAIPTRLHPPVYKAPNAAHLLAGKRSFEERYGPIPSPSAHQHASSITERPVARKSAAISQPGRRSNKTSQVFSSKQNPISRSATASPRKNKNRAGLRSSTDNARKPEPKSTKNKTPQTQRTGREIIEISDSDEEPARPVRLSSRKLQRSIPISSSP